MELIPAQLAHNAIIIILLLSYAIINILAWSANGIFRQELIYLNDTKNERTFSLGETNFVKIKPLLMIQYYLFFGLCLYTIYVPDFAQSLFGLYTLDEEVLTALAICISIPLIWFFLQYLLFHWICFIFGGDTRIVILERIYKAIHILAGPLAMLLFAVVVIAEIPAIWTAFLLTAIFIITQIIFIFSGIKIFSTGIGSFCLVFVYLCTLEIAPLIVIYLKLA